MKTIVVYESLWGNTAAIARAISEGIGAEAQALSTAEATVTAIADADLIVAGAPLLGFRLPSELIRKDIGTNPKYRKKPADLSHPSMRSWLATLPRGKGKAAAFQTCFRFSPGKATSPIMKGLERAGYSTEARPQKFLVTGMYGPLKKGEVERARAWGEELGKLIK